MCWEEEERKGAVCYHPLAGGFSWEGQRHCGILAGPEGLGSAPRSLSDCGCGENSLPPRSSVLHGFLLVGERLLSRAAAELGPFQHPTSLGRGSRGLPLRRERLWPLAAAACVCVPGGHLSFKPRHIQVCPAGFPVSNGVCKQMLRKEAAQDPPSQVPLLQLSAPRITQACHNLSFGKAQNISEPLLSLIFSHLTFCRRNILKHPTDTVPVPRILAPSICVEAISSQPHCQLKLVQCSKRQQTISSYGFVPLQMQYLV